MTFQQGNSDQGGGFKVSPYIVGIGMLLLTSLLVVLVQAMGFSGIQITAWIFSALMLLYSALYWMRQNRFKTLPLWGVMLGTLLLALPWFCIPPIGSTDVYSYGYFGRLQTAHHENPYTIQAQPSIDDQFFTATLSKRNFQSPYGPVWTGITALVTTLSDERVSMAVVIFRSIALVGLMILLWVICKMGVSPKTAVLVAWNPFILFETINNAHFDIWIALIAISTLCLWQGKQYFSVLWVLTVGGLLKFISFIVIIPLTIRVFRERSRRNAFIFLCAAILTPLTGVALGFLYYWEGLKTFHTVFTLAGSFQLPAYHPIQWVAWLMQGFLSTSQAEHLAHQIGIALTILAVIKVSVDTMRVESAVMVVLLAVLFGTLSYFQPWYMIWVIPLLLIDTQPRFQRLGLVLTLLGMVSYPWY